MFNDQAETQSNWLISFNPNVQSGLRQEEAENALRESLEDLFETDRYWTEVGENVLKHGQHRRPLNQRELDTISEVEAVIGMERGPNNRAHAHAVLQVRHATRIHIDATALRTTISRLFNESFGRDEDILMHIDIQFLNSVRDLDRALRYIDKERVQTIAERIIANGDNIGAAF